MRVRLQKFMAEAGVASRRASEQLIQEGRVSVNGAPVLVLGTRVDPQHDQILVDGTRVKTRLRRYLAVNKPRGILCTRSDPQGRQVIAQLLPKEWKDLYTIGRLDRASEGLVLMTNDGDFCLRVAHPRYGVHKTYHVTVRGRVEPELLSKLEKGVRSGRDHLRAVKARLLQGNANHSVLELELAEGKNREIRRLLEAFDLAVDRLQRVRIGPIRLGELPEGRWRTLTGAEINSLLAVV